MPTNYVSRRMIRIHVMQALYACLINDADATETFDLILKEYLDTIRKLEKKRGDHGDSQFLLALYFETINNREIYDKMIQAKAANWELDRIAMVDRILLQMGICEMQNFEEIPIKVSINEYLEIAKKFSTPKSSNFINGILDNLYLEFKESGGINKTGRGLIEYTVPKPPQVRRNYNQGGGNYGNQDSRDNYSNRNEAGDFQRGNYDRPRQDYNNPRQDQDRPRPDYNSPRQDQDRPRPDYNAPRPDQDRPRPDYNSDRPKTDLGNERPQGLPPRSGIKRPRREN